MMSGRVTGYTPDGFCIACGARQDRVHRPGCTSSARIETPHPGTYEVWNNAVLIATCSSYELANAVLEGISPMLDSQAEASFADGLEKARAALKRIKERQEPYDGRALACVHTKLDEAELWFTKVTP